VEPALLIKPNFCYKALLNMNITFVKKILADGSPCRKCGDVTDKLETNDQMKFIDQILVADESDPSSSGMQLAQSLSVDRAPFFVVEQDNGEKTVYTVYLKFVKEVLNQTTDAKEEAKDILDSNPDLDFI